MSSIQVSQPTTDLLVKAENGDEPSKTFTCIVKPSEIDSYCPGEHVSSVFYMQPQPLYDEEKPYFLNVPVEGMPSLKQTNVNYTRKKVAITDVRGHESLFSLEKNGFEIGKFETGLSYSDFEDSHLITSLYFQEVKDFLTQNTGAIYVLPFDYQVRRRDPSLPRNSRGAPGKAQPFASLHADQTGKAAVRRLEYFHPEEAAKYRNKRVQIVNVWKPLKGPVMDAPLAVCDYRTVDDKDRVPTDVIFPDYLGETYNFWPNPNHRLYYIDGQQGSEAWMIKCFDSATEKDPRVAQFAPHVSFPYRAAPGVATSPRESIEVRNFVFYD